jgi:hypothetical protein
LGIFEEVEEVWDHADPNLVKWSLPDTLHSCWARLDNVSAFFFGFATEAAPCRRSFPG